MKFSEKQGQVVEDLLHHRMPTRSRMHISIHFSVKSIDHLEREKEKKQKEATLLDLLHTLFPHWIISRFTEHSMFPGMWCAEIRSIDPYLSLLASAYFEKWGRRGIIDKDGYGVGGGRDNRWHTARNAWCHVDDPVQWVTDTYGDTLQDQFPKLKEKIPGTYPSEYIVDCS